eukprot:43009-Lingulodinium_polyedra.AAC.1
MFRARSRRLGGLKPYRGPCCAIQAASRSSSRSPALPPRGPGPAPSPGAAGPWPALPPPTAFLPLILAHAPRRSSGKMPPT